jgi:hypothetical protein
MLTRLEKVHCLPGEHLHSTLPLTRVVVEAGQVAQALEPAALAYEPTTQEVHAVAAAAEA